MNLITDFTNEAVFVNEWEHRTNRLLYIYIQILHVRW